MEVYMKLFLAIVWSFILVMHIVECATGVSASWFDVFIPLSVVFCDYWLDWGFERLYRSKNKNKHNDLDW